MDTTTAPSSDTTTEETKSPRTLGNRESLIVAKVFDNKETKEKLRAKVGSTGVYEPFDFTARFVGEVRIGRDYSRKATANFLRKSLLALLLKRLGAQREWIIENLPEIIKEVIELGEAEEEALFKSMPEFAEAMEHVEKMVANMKPIRAKGAVSLRGVTVEKLEALPASTVFASRK